jgi:hypothetical protein
MENLKYGSLKEYDKRKTQRVIRFLRKDAIAKLKIKKTFYGKSLVTL